MKTIYQCEVCGSKHDNEADAVACEALPMQDFDPSRYTDNEAYIPEVGEIVECCYPAYSWREGDPEWSVWRDRGGRFLDGYYNKWVVIAKIPAGDRHVWKYILWSPSTITGHERLCWTGPNHTRCFFNRKATDDEMIAARRVYEDFHNPQRIQLL